MPSYNKTMLMGNITRDIELRYTPKGTAVCDIGLAVNRTRTGDNGEKIEEVTFVDITLWGSTAEILNKYSGKGKPIFVEGRLQMDSWVDKNTGEKRTKLKIVGENIQLLGSKPEGGNVTNSAQSSNAASQGQQMPPRDPVRQQPNQNQPQQEFTDEGDDIPF